MESGFDRTRVSSTGAVGIWQIMPAHANYYGLRESDRSDIYKSTQVALNSLSTLHRKYKDWISVLAAYSCGEANVAKAMEKAGSKIMRTITSICRMKLQMQSENISMLVM